MSDQKGENVVGVAKPIRPMNFNFTNEAEANAFENWAVTKEKSTSETIKRVRSDFRAYKQMMRQRRNRNNGSIS
jgi:hypothetical protein